MSFLRLGTRCAVLNDAGHILLSKRGDFGTWSLPGGRVDAHEALATSAAREVREETGLEVEIVRAVGLYYQAGRNRVNVLYQARPTGGTLLASTDETLDNRFFPTNALPDNIFGNFYIDDVLRGGVHVRTQASEPAELWSLRLKLAWRWLRNLFAGRPEPRFPQFVVSSVGIIWDQRGCVATLDNPVLPRLDSDGRQALDAALNTLIGAKLAWQWVGLWQDIAQDRMTFVFEATVANGNLPTRTAWVKPATLADDQERLFVDATQQRESQTVWTLYEARPQ